MSVSKTIVSDSSSRYICVAFPATQVSVLSLKLRPLVIENHEAGQFAGIDCADLDRNKDRAGLAGVVVNGGQRGVRR